MELNNEILKDAIAHYIPHMEGWSDTRKCQQLAACIMETKPEISFEIGVFAGRGLVSMALAHRELNKGHAIGIDPWQAAETQEGENTPENNEYWANMDWGYIAHHFFTHVKGHQGLINYMKFHMLNSREAYNLFKRGSIGVIHQDGNHSEEVSVWEVMNYDKKLKKGGCWIMDDTGWETTKAAQFCLEKDLKYKLILEDGEKDAEGDIQEWKIYRKP
jgi:hypothetical protein